MSSSAKKWTQTLEERFGLRPECAGHLIPILERLAAQQPSVQEWDQLLNGLVAAFRAGRTPRNPTRAAETRALVDQFLAELQKLDESLTVLGVCLERLQRRVAGPPSAPERMLH